MRSNVKTRGILGEIQLSAILEQVLTKEQYDENVATKKGSSDRVEFAKRLPGDEDGGGLSAFVVFSMMGFYPVTPGLPVYHIGSPFFSSIELKMSNGKTLEIIARNCSD